MTYVPEPEDPRDLSTPQVDPRRANRLYGKRIRNTMGQIGFLVAAIGAVAGLLDGRPLWLIVSLFGMCFSLIGLARCFRGQANNKREVQIGTILGIIGVAIGIYWATKTGACHFVAPHEQEACVQAVVGLL